MIRSGFFNSVNQDRKYNASHFAEYFATFIGNGVFPNPSSNLQVMANDDMTVTVKVGKAWINGYILINDDDYILSIDIADGVLDRIDRVVLRYDVTDREIRIEVKKGTFASSPVAPTLQRDADAFELGIADIYIGKGVISINQGNITDLRQSSELCGVVHGVVDQVDVTTLYNQYTQGFELKKEEFEQEFISWFATLQDVLAENTATNLLNMINTLDNTVATHLADIVQHTTSAERGTWNNKQDALTISSSTSSTSTSQVANSYAVKKAYDKAVTKDYVTGVYTGDGTVSKVIALGFRPSMVYVSDENGKTVVLSGSKNLIYGGVAFDGYPVKAQTFNAVEVVSNGFKVGEKDVDTYIASYTNINGIYYYVAFKPSEV